MTKQDKIDQAIERCKRLANDYERATSHFSVEGDRKRASENATVAANFRQIISILSQ